MTSRIYFIEESSSYPPALIVSINTLSTNEATSLDDVWQCLCKSGRERPWYDLDRQCRASHQRDPGWPFESQRVFLAEFDNSLISVAEILDTGRRAACECKDNSELSSMIYIALLEKHGDIAINVQRMIG